MYDELLVRTGARVRTTGLTIITIAFLAAFAWMAHTGDALAAAAPEAAGETFAVSTNAAGEPAEGEGSGEYNPVSISEDGELVAFESEAANLGESGPAGAVEGYVKNLETGEVTLVTRADGVDGDPAEAPGVSNFVLSENGRYVMFTSAATNLSDELPGEETGETHVYRRDLETGETILVDRVSGEGEIFSRGAEGTSISGEGGLVTFTAYVANLEEPGGDHSETSAPVGYVADVEAGTVTAVTRASGATGELSDGERVEGLAISPEGNYVAFGSDGDNLTSEAPHGVYIQVYLRNLATHSTTLLSKNAAGEPGQSSSSYPTFSGGDGCYVEFGSNAENLPAPAPPPPGQLQVYVVNHCASPQKLEMISENNAGKTGEATEGGWLTQAVIAGGNKALFSGRFVDSHSYAWHLYERDHATGKTTLLDRASGETGVEGDGRVGVFAISANGCRAVFTSDSTNLGITPPTGAYEAYVRQLKPCTQDVDLRIEGKEETLFEGEVPTTIHKIQASSDTQERSCNGVNALDPENIEPGFTATLASVEAMESIGETFDGEWYGGPGNFNDYFITRWGPDEQDNSTGAYWGILVNQIFTDVGGCQYQMHGHAEALWAYDAFSPRPRLGLLPEAAHYQEGPMPTTATARVGVPFPVEVIVWEGYVEGSPSGEPSRSGSEPFEGGEVAPVATDAKGFQRVETSSPATVVTNAAGKASVTFTTPGIHRIKATVGEPGHETAIRSNGIEVDVLPAEETHTNPGGSGGSDGGSNPTPPTETKTPTTVSKPKLDRSGLKRGELKISWKITDPGASVKQWKIETKTLGKKGAKFVVRAKGKKGASATIHLPKGARYKVRFVLVDDSGHTTTKGLGTVSVPPAG
ncbi:MAG TPA: hypothetical protein VMH33_11440 [Solirubrobacterales bacterium]|nr:hypothetical protein [Solirubrobacterales bacterium]